MNVNVHGLWTVMLAVVAVVVLFFARFYFFWNRLKRVLNGDNRKYVMVFRR